MATFQWRDDFSKVLGAHSLKFGVQITRSRKDQNNSGANENGTVTFNTSAAKTSRNALADVLLGQLPDLHRRAGGHLDVGPLQPVRVLRPGQLARQPEAQPGARLAL